MAMLVVVYDGECVVCTGIKRVVAALDWRKRLCWVDLHDAARTAEAFPGLEQAEAMGQIHLGDEYGSEYAGFLVIRRMLKALPLTYPLWLLMHLPGMTRLGHFIYRFIAKRRYGVNRIFGRPVCDLGTCRLN
ncbi:MAG: DUF393 domain-containing protein [Anaerolineae bacterium]|nr:DUF393 domain-containing protein [Anaerolineae bacterium]